MTDYEHILAYVDQIVTTFPGVQSLWLIGSRANDNYRDNSDWDLLVFANAEVLSAMRQDEKLKRENIDILVVYDGIDFVEPWPEAEEDGRVAPKRGRLSGSRPHSWEWKQVSPTDATYEGAKRLPDGQSEVTIKRAVKLWPQERALN